MKHGSKRYIIEAIDLLMREKNNYKLRKQEERRWTALAITLLAAWLYGFYSMYEWLT